MTNNQIIFNAAISANLYTEDEAAAIIAKKGALPLHTYTEWQHMGYQVRYGERAVLVCDLWKHTNKPSKAARTAAEAEGRDLADDPHYYKTTARLFAAAQVDRKQDSAEAKRAAQERVRAINAQLAAQRHSKSRKQQATPVPTAPPAVCECEQIALF